MQSADSLEKTLMLEKIEGRRRRGRQKMRWYGEGGGRGVQDWEHVYTRGGFMLMYGKTITVL